MNRKSDIKKMLPLEIVKILATLMAITCLILLDILFYNYGGMTTLAAFFMLFIFLAVPLIVLRVIEHDQIALYMKTVKKIDAYNDILSNYEQLSKERYALKPQKYYSFQLMALNKKAHDIVCDYAAVAQKDDDRQTRSLERKVKQRDINKL